jgi:hypothetical protein
MQHHADATTPPPPPLLLLLLPPPPPPPLLPPSPPPPPPPPPPPLLLLLMLVLLSPPPPPADAAAACQCRLPMPPPCCRRRRRRRAGAAAAVLPPPPLLLPHIPLHVYHVFVDVTRMLRRNKGSSSHWQKQTHSPVCRWQRTTHVDAEKSLTVLKSVVAADVVEVHVAAHHQVRQAALVDVCVQEGLVTRCTSYHASQSSQVVHQKVTGSHKPAHPPFLSYSFIAFIPPFNSHCSLLRSTNRQSQAGSTHTPSILWVLLRLFGRAGGGTHATAHTRARSNTRTSNTHMHRIHS